MQRWHFTSVVHSSKLCDVFHYNDHKLDVTAQSCLLSVFIKPKRIANAGVVQLRMQKIMMTTVKMVLRCLFSDAYFFVYVHANDEGRFEL